MTVALMLLFIGCVTHHITKRVRLEYNPKGGLFQLLQVPVFVLQCGLNNDCTGAQEGADEV